MGLQRIEALYRKYRDRVEGVAMGRTGIGNFPTPQYNMAKGEEEETVYLR